MAFTNGLFRFEFDARRTAWCASCHAPSAADPRHVRDEDPVAQEGVNCVACHLAADGRMRAQSRGASSPHDTAPEEGFGDAEFCAGCHEFNFPVMGEDGMPKGFHALPMQETVSQFRRTSAAEKGGDCRQCHMRGAGGHSFPGSHDLPTLQSALELDLCANPGSLRFELANVGAAHAVPTGGVNRHMVLRSWRSSSPAELQEFFIGRRFETDARDQKVLVADTTLPAGVTRRYEMSLAKLGGETEEPVNYELRYIYPEDEFAELPAGTRRSESVFRGRTRLGEMARCVEER
jgi:hypothetical protein